MARVAARGRYEPPPLDLPMVAWAALVPDNPRFDDISPSADLAREGAERANAELAEAFSRW